MPQKIKLKRQSQTGLSAIGKRPTAAMLDDGELAINTVDGKLFLKRTPVNTTTGSPLTPVIVEVGANPFPSQTNQQGKFLTTDGTNVQWSTPSVVSAAAIDIVQNGHGFTQGTVLYHDGTTYRRAQANSVATADVIGVVTAVLDANRFTLTTNGYIVFDAMPSTAFVPGRTYYLSATTAGLMTDVEPTEAGFISKPLMMAINSTAVSGTARPRGFFYNWRGIANAIPFNDIDDMLPAQSPSTVGRVLMSGADGNAFWGIGGGGGGGGGSNSSISVSQVAHGFTLGTLVRHGGSAGVQRYVRSQANNATNAEVIGIVSDVISADSFVITTQGVVIGLSGLVPGSSYFLSDVTPGAFIQTQPSSIGSISKPVMIAISSSQALFTNWRGIANNVLAQAPEVASQAGQAGRYLTTNGTSTLWASPVTSFNARTGAVTLSQADVTAALGYTPYNGTTNPNNFVTSANVVASFNGRTGAVSLTLSDVTTVGAAPTLSPTFSGTPSAPTAAAGTNTTQLATTAFVTNAVSTKADLTSPAFSGTPTAPTAAAGMNTTQLATTAFVTNAVSTRANLASPAFTGNPTAPTPAVGDNDVSIATTAFVQTAIQTSGQNSQGAKTVQPTTAGVPSNATGNNGDIIYQYVA